jgi:hypothetical protein
MRGVFISTERALERNQSNEPAKFSKNKFVRRNGHYVGVLERVSLVVWLIS